MSQKWKWKTREEKEGQNRDIREDLRDKGLEGNEWRIEREWTPPLFPLGQNQR